MTGAAFDTSVIANSALTFEELRGVPLPAGQIHDQPDVRVARSLEEVLRHVADVECRTVLWKRDPDRWLPVLAALYRHVAEEDDQSGRIARFWNFNPHIDTLVKPAAASPDETIRTVLQLETFAAFAAAYPREWAILLQDMREIFGVVALMNESGRLRAWRFSDAPTPAQEREQSRTLQHYHPKDFSAIVDYSPVGAGTCVAPHESFAEVFVSDDSDFIRVTTDKKPFHLLPNVVVFMKGGRSSTSPQEMGTIHCSPVPDDAAFPYGFRLALGAYTHSIKAAILRAD